MIKYHPPPKKKPKKQTNQKSKNKKKTPKKQPQRTGAWHDSIKIHQQYKQTCYKKA